MYKRRIGVFKDITDQESEDDTESDSVQAQRTGLMSQKSRREYEEASRHEEITLAKFDHVQEAEKKDSVKNSTLHSLGIA